MNILNSNVFLLQIGLFLSLMSLMLGLNDCVRKGFGKKVNTLHKALQRRVIDSYYQESRTFCASPMIIFLGLSAVACYGLLAPIPHLSNDGVLVMAVLHCVVYVVLLVGVHAKVTKFWSELDWAIGIQSRTKVLCGRIVEIKELEKGTDEYPLLILRMNTGEPDVQLILSRQTYEGPEPDRVTVGMVVVMFYDDQQAWTRNVVEDVDKAIVYMTTP